MAHEQAFIAMHKEQFGGADKAKKIFAQKEETTQMWSLPKLKKKKKGSGGITNILMDQILSS